MAYPPRDEGSLSVSFPLEPFEPFDTAFVLPPRPRKFQSRLWFHALLFFLTLASTTLVGAYDYAAFLAGFAHPPDAVSWHTVLPGFWYSGTLLGILGAHEMGHYLLCRRYDVDATLPYFLPMPLRPTPSPLVLRDFSAARDSQRSPAAERFASCWRKTTR